MLIDTHAHLYVRQFQNDRDAVIQRATTEGVKKIYLPAIDRESHDDMLALEAQYPGNCFAMMGVHPCSIGENFEDELKIAENWFAKRPFCAVGEIGIDLYWDKTYFEQQKTAFIRQMHWAQDMGIPIVIHSRESTQVIIDILKENDWYTEGGIFHCFTGNIEQAKTVVDMGFYLGIGGVVTYKNAGLDVVVADMPLETMVLETDAPYLAPVPFRGKRNESSYIKHIAQKISEVKITDVKEVARVTTLSAEKVFSKVSSLQAF
jgi:TatD DNase family protein